MKFPKSIKHRGRTLATIYGKSKSYHGYRVAWSVAGHRVMKRFPRYSEAKRHADKLVKDLAKGSLVTALTPGQATDAIAALERLQSLYAATGQRLSLLGAVTHAAEALERLGRHSISDAVDGFLRTVATVKRFDIAQGVEQFISSEAPRTKAVNGHRAQLSGKYAYNRAAMLRHFAEAFPATSFGDLTKAHIDALISSPSISELAAKSRNHHRAAIRQLLAWAVRKDYLPVTHRLLEADGLRPEQANTGDVHLYTATEFKALLETAQGAMRAMIAIGGLAGLRTQELLRLSWEDTRRAEGHIEITKAKAKTRQRRLVEIVPALAQWLEPFKEFTGVVCEMGETVWQKHFARLCKRANVKRKRNGLRHSFCSYHFAEHSNENLTAAQAGNSPAMIHAHYKGLATKKEAEAWFAVTPQ